MAQFRFTMRATERDNSGYYFPRWDRAEHVEVVAETKQEAINKADAMLGATRHGRGWSWIFRVDGITEVVPSNVSEVIAYLDKTVDNVAGMDIQWKNSEVLALVADVRSLALVGSLNHTKEV